MRGRLLEHLRVLGIVDLSADDLDTHLRWALQHHPSHTQLLERVLGHAAGIRRERCCERRIHDSGMTVRHTLASFDWNFQPKLDRTTMPRHSPSVRICGLRTPPVPDSSPKFPVENA